MPAGLDRVEADLSAIAQSELGEANHSPPVDAPIVDPFRAPQHEFGPGNRGIEYDTISGQQVSASAPGLVTFADQVGGNLFVTVDHGGGLVTTAGFLDEILVEAGDMVNTTIALGFSGELFHFSARQDGVYIDPQLLFGNFEVLVRLVPAPPS